MLSTTEKVVYIQFLGDAITNANLQLLHKLWDVPTMQKWNEYFTTLAGEKIITVIHFDSIRW